MYRTRDRVFSGRPNATLVAEAGALAPGRALDVGCGEGADARWLAARGWRVTAVDVSGVALARAAGEPGGAAVRWQQADLLSSAPDGEFELVSVQYFPLLHEPGDGALRGLLGAVAPGGTFLFATHAYEDLVAEPGRGVDPAAVHRPAEIAKTLDDSWQVLVDETRPRSDPTPAGTGHRSDAVLVARRAPIRSDEYQ